MKLFLPDGTSYTSEDVAPKIQLKFQTWPASKGAVLWSKHDQYTEAFEWEPRVEAWRTDVPATVHLNVGKNWLGRKNPETLEMTPEIQWYYIHTHMIAWLGLSEKEAIRRAVELYRTSVCFNDGGISWDQGLKFDMANINMSASKRLSIKISIMTAGNPVLRVQGLTFKAIDPRNLPTDPAEHYKEHPECYFWCSQSTWKETGWFEWRGGRKRPIYECLPFYQFEPVGTLMPLIGWNGQSRFMESWRAEEYPNDMEYSPYIVKPGRFP